jgi:hypothetical protein
MFRFIYRFVFCARVCVDELRWSIDASRFQEASASLPEEADLLGRKTPVMAKRHAHSRPNRMRDLMGMMVVSSAPTPTQ